MGKMLYLIITPPYSTKYINPHRKSGFFLFIYKIHTFFLHISEKCSTFATEIVFNIKNTNENTCFYLLNLEGIDCNFEHPLNISIILVTLFVFHFEISGKFDKFEHP